MNIKLNNKDIELNFGIGFLRELDKIGGIDVEGVSMGMALTKTIPALNSWDPLALLNVVYSATHAQSPRPSMKDIEDYFNGLTDKQIEKTYADVLGELKKSASVRFTMNKLTSGKK